VTCPSCASPNEPGRKFCGECGARLAAVCSVCGSPNPPTVRFCGECGNQVGPGGDPQPAGAALAPAVTPPSAGSKPVAERRLVSVLFADLVGFTALAEGRDPETVRELLTRYFELATDVIGRYGGTVEKFIGDAVMAVWGAPTAHEDDAERAVRAGLDLVGAVSELGPGIQARCGVLTGEAAVTIGATGQGLVAGDLVNTASRLQSAAQPGTVLVGEETERATSGAIAYEVAGDQVLKGKAAPVPAWRALRVVAERRGRGRDDRIEAPFVGRDAELRLLKDLFHATARERRVRLVSITGQGGIGKTRLAREFLLYVDGVVEQVWWHEGRSPSYGEGITFWALGEMIRSRAGLLEGDDPATTRQRIGETLVRHVPDEAERRRLEPALLALLGAADAPAGGAAELFWAWRTFFERLTATGVVALLFEDLQWADTGTLDFIEHMVEWTRGVPILIVTLARPDLLDRRPDWGAGKRAFLALDLQPLDEPSMRELLTGLAPGLPEAAVRSIVTRAEGIPLYAVETIRMLVADGRLIERPEGGYEPAGELGELAIPATLHALIAARLDTLDAADRGLLQDAAVLGQSFAQDSVVAIAGGDPAGILARLDQLVRLELLRVEVDPRSPERGQYTFVQALIREVAYSTLSLRDRRARHLAAARHFEGIGDEELAGALAAHYLAAHRASSEGPEAEALAGQARIALRAAADRAIALGALLQAVTFLEQAIDVTPDPAERATLHERAGDAARGAGRIAHGLPHYDRAFEIRDQLGDRSGQARIAALQGAALGGLRRRDEEYAHLAAAFAEYEDLGDDNPDLIELMRHYAATAVLVGELEVALPIADRQLAAAERLGLGKLAADALITRAQGAFNAGRAWESRALTQGALDLFREVGDAEGVLMASSFLSTVVALDNPAQSLSVQRDAIDLARRHGRRAIEQLLVGNASEDARRTGDWAWAERELEQLLDADVDPETSVMARCGIQYYRLFQGAGDQQALVDIAREVAALQDWDLQASIEDIAATAAYLAGDWPDAARKFAVAADRSALNLPYILPKAGRAAVLAGDAATAAAVLERVRRHGARGRAVGTDQAVIAAGLRALEGDPAGALTGYRAAMAMYRDLGLAWDEAVLGLEAALVLGADDPEVAAWAERSRVILTGLQATPMLALLDRAVAPAAGAPLVRDPVDAAPSS
jgi:class 3 adenylate cyclase/tetratricopeptide (TPR) repeat protein